MDRRAPAASLPPRRWQAAADHEIGLTQVVTDGPEGDVTYHLQVDGGRALRCRSGEPEHVRMEQ